MPPVLFVPTRPHLSCLGPVHVSLIPTLFFFPFTRVFSSPRVPPSERGHKTEPQRRLTIDYRIPSPPRRRQPAAPPIRLLGLAPPAMAAEAGSISKVLIVVGNPIPCRFLLPKALLCSVSRFAYSAGIAALLGSRCSDADGGDAARQQVQARRGARPRIHVSALFLFSFGSSSASPAYVLSVRFQWNGLVRLLWNGLGRFQGIVGNFPPCAAC